MPFTSIKSFFVCNSYARSVDVANKESAKLTLMSRPGCFRMQQTRYRQQAMALSFTLAVAMLAFASSAVAANSAAVPISGTHQRWIDRHQSMSDRLKEGHAGVLWIGDSIVERWEKPGKPIWDKYYAHRNAVNLGISGDKTEHVLWRLDHCNIESVSPKLAIVMIGQNNGPYNTCLLYTSPSPRD